jgi:hypothetical protein
MHAYKGTTRKNGEPSATSLIDLIELRNLAPGDDVQSVSAEQINLPTKRKRSYKMIFELSVDLFFVALSLPPLLYALTTMHHNGKPLQENRRTADILLKISQIVRTVPNSSRQI